MADIIYSSPQDSREKKSGNGALGIILGLGLVGAGLLWIKSKLSGSKQSTLSPSNDGSGAPYTETVTGGNWLTELLNFLSVGSAVSSSPYTPSSNPNSSVSYDSLAIDTSNIITYLNSEGKDGSIYWSNGAVHSVYKDDEGKWLYSSSPLIPVTDDELKEMFPVPYAPGQYPSSPSSGGGSGSSIVFGSSPSPSSSPSSGGGTGNLVVSTSGGSTTVGGYSVSDRGGILGNLPTSSNSGSSGSSGSDEPVWTGNASGKKYAWSH